jgi:molybdenum cofactor cytidylyltransferase
VNDRRIAGIILAAGSSTRMGSPKALLSYRGETFLDRLVRMFQVYCEDVLVVSSQPIDIQGARVIVNPLPERGMLSSLQCGLAAVRAAARAVAFTPVDYPAIQQSTVERVIAEWTGELLRIPRHAGRRGHPVLLSRELILEFLALPATAEARQVVRRHEREIVYAEVDDPGILQDIDTPADYEQLR